MLPEKEIEEIAESLFKSERERKTMPPLTEKYPGITIEDSYKIQSSVLKRKKNEKVVGKKIGLTSKPMQDLLGVNEPDYGYITDKMVIPEGGPVNISELIQPKIEGEIAFVFGEGLKGPGVTASEVLKKTIGVVPAIEVIDSRIKDWKIKIQDTIADNASSARVILGSKLTSIKDIDLRLIGLVLEKNGKIVSTGAGAAVLGSPAQAVAWLANKLSEFDVDINPNEFVMSGSLVKAEDVKAGDCVTATFDRLGKVSTRFV
ncbi:MAG: fumarylacetoacetate hydrolase family protein [Methanomicrobia archaeon]|nr:fumarylacetoacetate hydrolase family protein [Methanomicrobia archaeon]RLF33169.1 MAG: 2-keto-4-pentenoate hydratase [Thermoplasmata archaeon]RLG02122.1 MAG: 2-keto-4-pentenoate hydratase [Thermococci archaeon]